MKRALRIELIAAGAALALALVAGLYLIITTFVQHESCYGIQYPKVQCQPVTGQNLAQTAARVAVALSVVLVLYAGGALAAWAQRRAEKPDSRLTAYMALVTCALTALGVTLPAVSGVGYFFLPSTILILAAAVAGLPPLLETYRKRPGQGRATQGKR